MTKSPRWAASLSSKPTHAGFDRGTCSYDGIWFGFTTDTTETQRQEVYGLFTARDDVIAVIVQQELYPNTEEDASAVGWYAQVRFREPTLPPDIDQLVDQPASMPGVVDPGAWMNER